MGHKISAGRAAAAALVALLVIFIIVSATRASMASRALAGFWTAHSDFLDESGLGRLDVYIPPAEGWPARNRSGYVTAVDVDGVVVANAPIDITHGPLTPAAMRRGPLKFRVGAASEEAAALGIVPDGATFVLDPARGTLEIVADDVLHAYLVRDNEVSLTANEMYEDGAQAEIEDLG